ncbi:probable protein arginine N-methyltransferase 6.1 [Trifolium pratense]|nr:probable protein arginine N-methyltransferase 6.1 [Trifolium pratense]
MENNGEVGDSESKIEISDDSLSKIQIGVSETRFSDSEIDDLRRSIKGVNVFIAEEDSANHSASLNVFNAEEDSASHNGEVGDSESKIQISKIQIGGNSDSEIDDLRRSIKGLNVFNVEEDSASHSSADNILFKNYEEVSVHRNMLQDTPRMVAYKSAISYHQKDIEGKVIVDVGCGTGILSILCARAGARKVYAIEASGMALHAETIVKVNGLSDVIKVLHCKVEDATIEEQVDVIISEWMGNMLFQENMLPTVISARDRWLAVGGLLLPSSASLYMAPFSDRDRYYSNIGFWSNVDGINMSVLIPSAKTCFCSSPKVETVELASLLADPHQVIEVDMHSISSSDLDSISTAFEFHSYRSAPLHGFALWFDTRFSRLPRVMPGAPILSTAPSAPSTHWQQTLLDCEDPIDLEEDQVILGSLEIKIDRYYPRILHIDLSYGLKGGELSKIKTSF